MAVPAILNELVERFERGRDSYVSPGYNEAQVRREFIDRLFEEGLGWDIRNVLGASGSYKDVVHEDRIQIEGGQKAPDYSFRVGGTRKFFLEAKKPSVEIKENAVAAFQLRRYAWSSKLQLSVLTNFREFSVYDCRIRPKSTDRASVARILYLPCGEYAESWDRIAGVFSKDAVLRGSFDKYATSEDKRGTSEVDKEFLTEIESWRDSLAHNVALRNPNLSVQELNSSVQITIDRVIFLRMCEDRGIEKYGQLKDLLDGGNIYARLFKIFESADDKYNSGIFHFQTEEGRKENADDITPHLEIDDSILADILKGLYYPDSPYEFSVLPATVLGSVYEQFLGKVIRLTAAHHAKVEEKPEVKKAGGVYYTPEYIVDLIVAGTVGHLMKGKSPRQVEKMVILDPACGSGSFLVGAYSYLLNFYIGWYIANDPRRHRDSVYQLRNGEWRLTTGEKKRILVRHIFGVDIDRQAVEVTKLNLLLKVLEDENRDSFEMQQKLWRERALPDLAENIKCGNSIIGSDYFKSKLFTDEEELLRTNPFDWRREYPCIMDSGGFDAVIGNPPYVDSEWMTTHWKDWRDYCTTRYRSASGNWDLFCVFVEKALNLCKKNGYASMIVPNKIGSAAYAAGVRDVLTVQNSLLSIRDYSRVPVFPVAVYPIVFFAKKGAVRSRRPVHYERMAVSAMGSVESIEKKELDYSRHFAKPDETWPIFSDTGASDLVARLSKQFPPLESVADVWGAATVAEAYEIAKLVTEGNQDKEGLRVINSGTIDRYVSLWGSKKMKYLGKSFEFPIVTPRAARNLPEKRRQQAVTPKIVVASMTKRLECAIDFDGAVLAGKSTSIVIPRLVDLRYLSAVLNSKLIGYWFLSKFGGNALAGGFLRIGPPQLRLIPIRSIDPKRPDERASYQKLVGLVDRALQVLKLMSAAKSPDGRALMLKQIEDIEQEIDETIFSLYGLSEAEKSQVRDFGEEMGHYR